MMACVPGDRLTVSVAVPAASAAVPTCVWSRSVKLTRPVGVPAPWPETVAVSVTPSPGATGATVDVRTVADIDGPAANAGSTGDDRTVDRAAAPRPTNATRTLRPPAQNGLSEPTKSIANDRPLARPRSSAEVTRSLPLYTIDRPCFQSPSGRDTERRVTHGRRAPLTTRRPPPVEDSGREAGRSPA